MAKPAYGAESLNTSHELYGRFLHGFLFNEGSGTTAHDCKGSNTGTLQTGASFAGAGLTLASNGYVTCASGVTFGTGGVFAIAARVRKSIASGAAGICGIANSGFSSAKVYFRTASTSGFHGTGGWTDVSVPEYEITSVHNVLLTFDGSYVRYYYDNDAAVVSTITTNVPDTLASVFTMGRPGDYNGQYLTGEIESLYVFNGNVTAGEWTPLKADWYGLVTGGAPTTVAPTGLMLGIG